jgi:hypothetical protein
MLNGTTSAIASAPIPTIHNHMRGLDFCWFLSRFRLSEPRDFLNLSITLLIVSSWS